MSPDKDLIPRFWFCLLFTFPFFVRRLDPSIQLLLATIVMVVGNWSYFQRAWKDKLSAEMLFSISVGVLYVYSLLEGLLSSAPILHYKIVASVTIVILLEQLFEQYAVKQSSIAEERLLAQAPKIASKLFYDGHTEQVMPDSLKEGDSIRVMTGDIIAVDGVVYSGEAEVDESFISGDSKPVHKVLGSVVHASTKNTKGTCLVRATNAPNQSIYDKVVDAIANADNESALQEPSGNITNAENFTFGNVSTVAFVVAIALSCAGFFFWSLFSSISEAVLVVSTLCIALCPCAILLSNHVLKKIVLGEAANQGIVIRSKSVLEQIAKCNILVVNKNGTLTVGKPTIASLDPSEGTSADELLRIAASLEAKSTHPYAKCILDKAEQISASLLPVEELTEVSGLGIQGIIEDEVCVIGDEKLVHTLELGFHRVRAEDMRKQGYIVLFCARGKKLLGIIVLSDPIRKGVKASLKEFKNEGFQLFCLSGDRRITVVQLVNALGFDRFQAEAPSQQKIFTVKKLQNEGKTVLMVGDPMKDAAALAQADVGVMLGTKGFSTKGLDAEKAPQENALDNVPVTLLEPSLSAALRLLGLGKKTIAIINQNKVISFGYMVIIAFMALFGAIGPTYGAICMLAATIVLGLNSLRLQKT